MPWEASKKEERGKQEGSGVRRPWPSLVLRYSAFLKVLPKSGAEESRCHSGRGWGAVGRGSGERTSHARLKGPREGRSVHRMGRACCVCGGGTAGKAEVGSRK